jgi:hypothetical protein
MFITRFLMGVAVATGAGIPLFFGSDTAGGGPAMVINEVMYLPPTGGSEWIEIWNVSGEAISLREWTLEDSRGRPSLMSSDDLIVNSGDFLVLAAQRDVFLAEFPWVADLGIRELEGSWPTLNNNRQTDRPYADLVVLRDGTGSTVDSLAYGEDWGVAGCSLERLSPEMGSIEANWAASLAPERATPGTANSVFFETEPRHALYAEPNPFRPEFDGTTFVSFRSSLECPTVRLQVFDSQGRLVRTLLDDRNAGRTGRLGWDGRDEAGGMVPLGIYILYLQAIDVGDGRSEELKSTVVIVHEF